MSDRPTHDTYHEHTAVLIPVRVLCSCQQRYRGSVYNHPSFRGRPDDTWGWTMVFPPCKLSFSLLTAETNFFFPLRQRTHNSPPHITPFFCQFCQQTFHILRFAEQTICLSPFAKRFLPPPPKKRHIPPHTRVIWSAP